MTSLWAVFEFHAGGQVFCGLASALTTVATATARPSTLGRPFTRWSLRKLADYLATDVTRTVNISRERLRQILRANDISWQRTLTWRESKDPDLDAKLDRIEYVTTHIPQRCFAFDQFGPLSIRPHHGSSWALESHPDRLPATYHRTHGIRYFHGCYSLGDDQLWGVPRRRKGGDHTLSALKSIRRRLPDGGPIYVIMDNLSANKTPQDPGMGGPQQGRAVLDADQCVLGKSDRGAVRAATHVHHGELEPPEPHRPRSRTAQISALAQSQRPPSRRPGRPTSRHLHIFRCRVSSGRALPRPRRRGLGRW
jgi:hypothetical protein